MTTDDLILNILREADAQNRAPIITELADWVERTPRAILYAVDRLERRRLVKVARRGQRPKALLIMPCNANRSV